MLARSFSRIPLAALVALVAPAIAQSPFDGCGTIVGGTHCLVMFQADVGGLYFVGDDAGGFAIGNRVRVVGTLDPYCLPICQQGDGCIEDATLGLCAHAITPLCFGDGSGTSCPCAGAGAPDSGCPNSTSLAGARLSASGNPSVTADTVVLSASGMSGARALYFQAAQLQAGGAGQLFGDGLLCASGATVRLATVTDASGASSYPAPGGVAISVRGGVLPGQMRFYQVQYRDLASFCTAAQYNFTNAIQVTWGA
jgi:hypothetical protein